MNMRIRSVLTTVASTVAAIGMATAFAATPAAAVPQKITVTNPNVDGHYAASSDVITLTDHNTHAVFKCEIETHDEDGAGTPGEEASTAGGSIPSGTYTLPATVGGITSLGFNYCTWYFGPLYVSAVPPYLIVFQNYPGEDEYGNPRNGDGYIDGVVLQFTSGPCSFTVTGNLSFYYVNDGARGELHILAVPPDDVELPDGPTTASNVSGCSGLINDGDVFTIEGIYTITDPVAPSITATSA